MTITDDGGMTPADISVPHPAADEVVIDVAAAGVNRADLLQLKGLHPPPQGAATWPGLEVSGTVSQVGGQVSNWSVGDRVAALVDGGGYAEQARARAGDLLAVPTHMDLAEAAAFPEALGTLWSNLAHIPGLDGPAALLRPDDCTPSGSGSSSDASSAAGRTILIHGGSGGVGSVAIQLFSALGATVYTTAGGPERAERCLDLGASAAIDHRSEVFTQRIADLTDGRGVDAVLDPIGAAYLDKNVSVLAPHGHLAMIGMQKGTKGNIDLGPVLFRWLTIHGTILRGRQPAEKALIMGDVARRAWPLATDGTVRPVIHDQLPLEQASEAHRLLADGIAFGKVLLLP